MILIVTNTKSNIDDDDDDSKQKQKKYTISAVQENFSANEYENANNCCYFDIYKQRKFSAQLS